VLLFLRLELFWSVFSAKHTAVIENRNVFSLWISWKRPGGEKDMMMNDEAVQEQRIFSAMAVPMPAG
jgi:hypothetical protein